MGSFRFWRRLKLAPGVTLNLSKTGASVSLGPRGAHYTIGSRGQRATVGIPGTGLFYTQKLGATKRKSAQPTDTTTATPHHPLGWLDRLKLSDPERALAQACSAALASDPIAIERHLSQAANLPDAAFMLGVQLYDQGRFAEAAQQLVNAVSNANGLGATFAKLEIDYNADLRVTEEISGRITSSLHGALLLLVEVYQRLGRLDYAEQCLERLLGLEPDDPVIKLSLAELLLERPDADARQWQRVVQLSEGLTNQSAIHSALLLYRGRALRLLGLLQAARDTLSSVLRITKDRPSELITALRYERALTYEALGDAGRCRKELELVYAADADYADVAQRLGLQ